MFLVSAGALALGLAAPAVAQDEAPESGPPECPEGSTDPECDDETVITVTGYRASVQRAQEIKRDAPSVVEVITSEDLGKFSDPTLSDALQRVPGVSITRNYRGQDEGDTVVVRGLGAGFLKTTVNGRDLMGTPGFFGSNGRNFDFAAIPPEILGAVTIYKSPTASLIEPGLAGAIDLQTLRPLDSRRGRDPGFWGSVTAMGSYNEDREELTPRVSGILGWTSADERFGAYVSGGYSIEKTRGEYIYTFDNIQGYNLLVPDGNGGTTQYLNASGPFFIGSYDQDRDDTRLSFSGGVQWRPTDRLEINLDGLYNKYEKDLLVRGSEYFGPAFELIFTGLGLGTINPGAVRFSGGMTNADGAIIDSNIVYLDTTKIDCAFCDALLLRGYQQAGYRQVRDDNELYNFGGNIAWQATDSFRIVADASYSAGTFFEIFDGVTGKNNLAGGTKVIYDVEGGRDLPLLTFVSPPGADPSNPDSYTFEAGFYRNNARAKSSREAYRIDLENDFNDNVRLKAGVRFAKTSADFRLAVNAAVPAENTDGIFNETVRQPLYGFSTPWITPDHACSLNPGYCGLSNRGVGSFTGGFPTSPTGSPEDELPFDPTQAYEVKEENLAVYGQMDFRGNLGGLDYTGNTGVRVVRIKTIGRAFQGVETRLNVFTGALHPDFPPAFVLVRDEHSYTEILPSLNLNLHPADNINLRFGVARTMSPAQYIALAPKGAATIVRSSNGTFIEGRFTGGNTRLDPTLAWNYDITAEYYTDYGGAFIASLFYKDLDNLVTGSTSTGTIPGQGDLIFSIQSVGNSERGKTYGFELGTNQPFTFLPDPWDGFGFQANYTYVQSENAAVLNGVRTVLPFPGFSKHNFNGTLYYEDARFSARLAFFYRSREFQLPFLATSNRLYIDPQYSLDLNLSYKVTDYLELIATGTNLTERDARQSYSDGTFRSFFGAPRVFQIGARATF